MTEPFESAAHALAASLRGRYPAVFGVGTPGRCPVIAFMAGRRGEGTSTVARETALALADTGRRDLLLLDIDEAAGGQVATLRSMGLAPDPVPAAADPPLPWRLSRLGGRRLWVNEGAPAIGAGDLGEALDAARARFACILVDVPAVDRSNAADRIAAEADLCVLVVAAESTRGMVALALRDRILNAGGTIAGVVMTRRRFHIPERVYRWL